jgi:signal transduction histidine kinase
MRASTLPRAPANRHDTVVKVGVEPTAPSPAPRRALGWALFGIVAAIVAATLVADFALGFSEDLFLASVAGTASLVYAAVASLIVARHPRNAIGWILFVVALSVVLTGAAEGYMSWSAERAPDLLPGAAWAAWLANWILIPVLEPIPLLLLLFPTGRPPTRRWWPVAWGIVLAGILGAVGFMVDPDLMVPLPGPGEPAMRLDSPTGVSEGLSGILLSISAVLSLAGTFLAVAAVIVRFRRSRGEERQQLRWLVYTAGVGILLLVSFFLSFLFTGEDDNWLSNLLFILLVIVVALAIPLACGIAILRYRLYQLDVVVKKTVVFGALVVFGTVVYVGVVVGLGALIGGADNAALTFAGAAIVALAFQPVRGLARRLADRLVYGKRATPYEVLSRFTGRMGGAYSTDDVLPRMAQLITAGTGSTRAEIWLRVGPELRLEARAPQAEATPPPLPVRGQELPTIPGADEALPVVHQGELLGAIAVAMPPSEPLGPTQRVLLEDLAHQAGLVLRNVRLIEELRASRQRLVQAQDEERRRIERNLHDGAQQQLVALAVKLRLAEQLADRDPARAKAMLAQLRSEAGSALEDLRDLARGIYPPLLADRGLPDALQAQARKAAVDVGVDAVGVGRHPQDVETAVYFCVLEALQNVAKYAEASRVDVRLRETHGDLTFAVTDDGRGFDPAANGYGTGLQGMADRIEALGGSLRVRSTPGEGTVVEGTVPGR